MMRGDKPKESDWKTFRKMVPDLRERSLRQKNQEIIHLLSEKGRTPTERFWAADERLEKEARIRIDGLDGHSRSKMTGSMFLMVRHGLLNDSDPENFSEDLREDIKRSAEI